MPGVQEALRHCGGQLCWAVLGWRSLHNLQPVTGSPATPGAVQGLRRMGARVRLPHFVNSAVGPQDPQARGPTCLPGVTFHRLP